MTSQPDQQPSSASHPELVPANAWERSERKFTNKTASEYYDPCQDFADRSLKCMKRNAYDREMCHDYFHDYHRPGLCGDCKLHTVFVRLTCYRAYRDCKKQWLTQKKLATSQVSKS